MRIGSIFFGKIKKLNGQHIETKFFMLGIPLFPIKSLFVTKIGFEERDGIEIGLNTDSVLKGLFGPLSLLLAFLLIFLDKELDISNGKIIDFVFLIVGLFFLFIIGGTSDAEKEIRLLYQKAIGINALPEYFAKDELDIFLKMLIQKANSNLQVGENWIKVIENKSYNDTQLPILFATMGYFTHKNNTESNMRLFDNLKIEFQKLTPSLPLV